MFRFREKNTIQDHCFKPLRFWWIFDKFWEDTKKQKNNMGFNFNPKKHYVTANHKGNLKSGFSHFQWWSSRKKFRVKLAKISFVNTYKKADFSKNKNNKNNKRGITNFFKALFIKTLKWISSEHMNSKNKKKSLK